MVGRITCRMPLILLFGPKFSNFPNIAVLRLNPNETSFAVKKPFSKLESTLLSVGFQTRLNFFPYQRCDRLTPGDICIGPICGNDNWIGIWCDAPHVNVSSKLRKLNNES